MNGPLSLTQRLLLVKWLTDQLVALRKDDLLPEAQSELVVGERAPVKFAGKVAGWVNMPKPSRTASVTDEGKLLAWCEQNAPHAVTDATEVRVSAALIEYLRESAPHFLAGARKVDPDWAEDTRKGLRERGYIVTFEGEKITDVPGITVSDSESVPRVSLNADAGWIIGQAWNSGDIGLSGLLALPAGGEG